MAFAHRHSGRAKVVDIGTTEAAGIGATVVAGFTSWLAYLTGKRLKSGSVGTTEAGQLWEQMNRAMVATREDANLLRQEVRELRNDVRQRDDTIERLEVDLRHKSRQVDQLEREVARLIELLPPDVRSQYNALHFDEEVARE